MNLWNVRNRSEFDEKLDDQVHNQSNAGPKKPPYKL